MVTQSNRQRLWTIRGRGRDARPERAERTKWLHPQDTTLTALSRRQVNALDGLANPTFFDGCLLRTLDVKSFFGRALP